MAKFSLNTNNIKDTNLVLTGIALQSTFGGFGNLDIPLSQINVQGDINGDGNNDIFVQSSLSFISNTFTQDNFVIFGSDSLPNTIDVSNISAEDGLIIENALIIANGTADINGDNIDDLLLTTSNGGNFETTTNVIFGSQDLPATIDLEQLDSSDGFRISDGENNVVILSAVGDINNDEINDFAILSSPTQGISSTPNNSTSKIIFGRENYDTNLDISNLDGTDGFSIASETALISGTGFNINGDEFDDLFIVDSESAIAYIVFGRSQYDAELDLSTLAADQGYTITQTGTTQSNRFFGSFAEDINGDGIDDILIQRVSETEDSPTIPEELFIIYGSNSSEFDSIDLDSLDGSNGFTFNTSVELQAFVDLNGDNLQDLFVQNTADNRTYVIFGSDSIPNNFDLNTLDGSNGFVIENTNLSPETSFSLDFNLTGDINADGVDDIALTDEDNNRYILLGSQEVFPANIDLIDLETNAIAISGEDTTNGIAGFADINNDGSDEIIFNTVIADEENNLGSVTTIYGDSELSFTTDTSLTIELFRFRNTSFDSGTYVFVGAAERDFILSDPNLSNTFSLDGRQEDGSINPAFKASTVDGENLIPFFRLKSLEVLGTFLFVSTAEYDAIFADDSNQNDKWEQEGLDENGIDIPEFYLLDGSVDGGITFNRFQNTQNNTFLYAGPDETNAINENPNLSGLFFDQGTAFKSLV